MYGFDYGKLSMLYSSKWSGTSLRDVFKDSIEWTVYEKALDKFQGFFSETFGSFNQSEKNIEAIHHAPLFL